ncbi:Hsp20/alpha crystallin family protein [Sulfurovum sp. ST-21]|uniref:Hsp20/alpha crystallin family protein n=1 Tax=Sulfurovum indicum TaxID=2779528 RepID=A0A7M1S934_9BACT|nr:Hsp20/alpha crystallin family protein [Sulfurovum indicum]QOR62840.1 Hsp20/alpha crystallin family protein [Sulfurovum indicum]
MLRKKLSLLALPLVAAVSLQAQDPFNDPFFSDPFGDDIFKEMIQMQHRMDEMFKRMEERMYQRSSRLVSPLGTYRLARENQFSDKGDHYELLTNIPESKENHIDITTKNGIISISAKIVSENESKTNGMISTSRSVQMFQQSASLPQDADENGIKSTFKDGKLLLSIPKKQKGKTAATAMPHKQEKRNVLPRIDENLKNSQLSVEKKDNGEKSEKKEDENEKKRVSLSDRTSMS